MVLGAIYSNIGLDQFTNSMVRQVFLKSGQMQIGLYMIS